MNTLQHPLATESSTSVSSVQRTRDERLIHTVMPLVAASVYGWSLFAAPELRALTWLIPFTTLMLLHAALHLIAPYLSPRRRWLPIYFVVQGVLVFVINQMTGIWGTTCGLYLYLGLIAQSIGLLNNHVRLMALIVSTYFTLATINVIGLWGWAALPEFFLFAVPQTFFVVVLVILFFQQANARKRAQELLSDLETAHRQLTEYAAQVEDLTLVNERQRLARELHDTLAQGLAGLILQLEAVDQQLTRERPQRAQAIVQQAMTRARLTLADARRAIDDLRMGDATSESLTERVRDEVERFTAATGIPCDLDCITPSPIPDSLQEPIFRAVAEGLTNVARHARASRAWVRLSNVDDDLEIVIGDDGSGFDSTEANGQDGHYGLTGLRERARLAGGSFEIASEPGGGTTLTLRLPITEGVYG